MLDAVFGVKKAHAAEVPAGRQQRQATPSTAQPPVPRKAQPSTLKEVVALSSTAPVLAADSVARAASEAARAEQEAAIARGNAALPPSAGMNGSRTAEAKMMLDQRTFARNRYSIEIYKKFSLAAACLIFVVLAAPLAVRFPRGGVGLVIGVSLIVFALYYVGLIGGEALANKGYVSPFLAMWGTNIIMTAVGIVLLFRMGRDSNTGRGGDWGDWLDRMKRRFGMGGRRTA
jgi:lipopolysaccharide export system permease protein